MRTTTFGECTCISFRGMKALLYFYHLNRRPPWLSYGMTLKGSDKEDDVGSKME